MPEYLAPAVYVEETSFRSKSIGGVGTSTAAFVGLALAVSLGAFATAATIGRASIVESTDPAVLLTAEFQLREGPNPAAKSKRPPASMVPGTLLRVTDQRGEWVKLAWPGGTGWTNQQHVRRLADLRATGP